MRRAAIELTRNQPAQGSRAARRCLRLLTNGRIQKWSTCAGSAYLRTGRGTDAAAEFRKIIVHKGAAWGPRYPLAYLGLARAAAQTGDADGARKVYQGFSDLVEERRFLDIPCLIEAKREYARLH